MTVVHEGKYDNLDPRAWTYDLGKSRAVARTGSNGDWFMPQRLNSVPVMIIPKTQWDKSPSL